MNNEIQVFNRDEYDKLREIEKATPDYFGYTYILEYDDKVKIGCTRCPYQRISALRISAENYGNGKLGKVGILPCCSNYASIEKLLHSAFSEKRINGTELFKLHFNEIIQEIRSLRIEYFTDIKKEEEKRLDVLINLAKLLRFDGYFINKFNERKEQMNLKNNQNNEKSDDSVEYYDIETQDEMIRMIICDLEKTMRLYKLPVGYTYCLNFSIEKYEQEETEEDENI